MLHTPPPAIIRPACTFYTDSSRRKCSNGLTYRQNARKYRYFVASNHYRLGSCVPLTSRYGHARAYVVDRVGHGTDFDANINLAKVLLGRHYRDVGRVTVRVGPASAPPVTARRRHKGGRGR